jgi:uncharacterized protein (DUF2062 family)
MTADSIHLITKSVSGWLRQGVSPRRLALTLALGFTIGCLPVVGIPTLLCVVVAFALRLKQPAIQAANFAVMPLQWLLMAPLIRLGGRLFGSGRAADAGAMLHAPSLALLRQICGVAGQALLAWLLIAIPAVALMTAMLTVLLRRLPAVGLPASNLLD